MNTTALGSDGVMLQGMEAPGSHPPGAHLHVSMGLCTQAPGADTHGNMVCG